MPSPPTRACAAALDRAPGEPARLRAIAAVAATARPEPGAWLSEAAAKALLRDAAIAVPEGREVGGEDDAVAAARELGGPVAVKATAAGLRHKSEAGAVALGVRGDDAVRAAFRRVAARGGEPGMLVETVAEPDVGVGRTAEPGVGVGRAGEPGVLVERMAEPGVEVLVAVRRDAVVPALVVGLGGVWTELLDDVAIIPLPASPARVEAALRGLRAAAMLTGARGGAAVDLAALAALAASAGELALAEDLTLLELNPVISSPGGAVAVDAVARR